MSISRVNAHGDPWDIEDYRKHVDRLKAEHRLLGKQLTSEKKSLGELEQKVKDLDKAQAVIQEAAIRTQETLKIYLTATATTALQAVFQDKDYEFRVTFVTNRGRTEAVLEVGEGDVFSEPMEVHGGGIVDILSFSLRLAFRSISQSRSVMVLDEPFRFLSQDLQPLAAQMVKYMSDKLGIQVIMVTHIEEMQQAADRVFKISRKGRNSTVEVVR